MKKNLKKFMAGMLATVMLASVFTGCGKADDKKVSSDATPKAEDKAATGLDTSKKVELVFWMLGDPPKDLQLINDEINKLAMKDLNCTVKYNMTTWTDWGQKYKMLLSSGEPIDLIFTAEWTDYQNYAKKGAFMALDEIVPKAAPDLYKWIPKDYWEAVKIDGKIQTIPATWKEYVSDGLVYRKDLVKKYNLAEPNSMETIEAYFDAIKKNEKAMMPLNSIPGSGGPAGYNFGAMWAMTSQLNNKWLDRNMPIYGLVAENAKPTELKQYWGTPEHKKDLETAKRWADKGFWSKSILSNKDDEKNLFENGKVAAYSNNANRYADSAGYIKSNHPDWEVGYFAYPSVSKVVHPVHPVHNGFAVPKTSKNPERAVAFYSKMVLDKKYNYLTQYGIEGKHFAIDNGYYKMIGDQTSNGFKREEMNGWAWRNPEIMLFDKSFDPVKDIFKQLDAIATPDIFNGFAEDYTPYQSERTALDQVQQQYLVPLQAGFVADIDKGMKEFMDKAKAAGLEKIQAEYIKQWKAYCQQMNIK